MAWRKSIPSAMACSKSLRLFVSVCIHMSRILGGLSEWVHKPPQLGSERGSRIERHHRSNCNSCSFAHGLPLLAHSPCSLHGPVEVVSCCRVRYESGATVFHDFGTSACICDNCEPAAHHRLDKHQWQPFGALGRNQRVVRFPDRFNVAHKPSKINVVKA